MAVGVGHVLGVSQNRYERKHHFTIIIKRYTLSFVVTLSLNALYSVICALITLLRALFYARY